MPANDMRFRAEHLYAEIGIWHLKCPNCANMIDWTQCSAFTRAFLQGHQRVLWVITPTANAEQNWHAAVLDIPTEPGGDCVLTPWESVASAIEDAAGRAMSDVADRGTDSSRLVTLARASYSLGIRTREQDAAYLDGQATLIADAYGLDDDWLGPITNMITAQPVH